MIVDLAVLAAVLLTALARRLEGSWLGPGTVFTAYWALILVATKLVAPEYVIPAIGPWYIVAVASAVVAGSYLASTRGLRPRERADLPPAHPRGPGLATTAAGTLVLRSVSVAGFLSGIAATLLLLGQHGFSLSALASQNGLFQVGNALAVARYSGADQSLGSISLLLAVTYAGTLAAPFLLTIPAERRPTWVRVYTFAPLLGAIVFSVITTARLPMLLAVGFTFLSVIVGRSMQLGRAMPIRPRHVLGTLVAVGLVGVSFALIALVRAGPSSTGAGSVDSGSLKIYSVGYVSSFSQWLADPTADRVPSAPSPSFGAATLGAPSRILGIDPVLSTAYQDYREIDRNPNDVTNIYTAFRAAINDFTAAGALLFFAAVGFAGTRAWRSAVEGRQVSAGLAVVVIYAFMLNTNSQSIFWFSNICLAAVLAAVCLNLSFRGGAPLAQDAESGRLQHTHT